MNTQVSVTALGAAKMRAAHLLLDEEPKIFHDDFAFLFSGGEEGCSLEREMDAALAEIGSKIGLETAKRIFQSSRAVMLSRSRFTEDALQNAIAHGVKHYVILGAGLDSFAWRHPELSVSIQVVEIDHPASQKWKRMRLREIGLAEPPNLVFIPLDFETQTLLDGLRHVGIGQEPDFFCWLGVTQYLSRKSVLETLERMSGMPSGTELAFTLIVPPELLNPEDRRFSVIAAKAAADRVEPQVMFFGPDEMVH